MGVGGRSGEEPYLNQTRPMAATPRPPLARSFSQERSSAYVFLNDGPGVGILILSAACGGLSSPRCTNAYTTANRLSLPEIDRLSDPPPLRP